jgi:mannose-1-phosphate guanylyltransferase/mannose-1-phosphate guanylyltransferase/mannose-6-phosphate isomerase
MNFIPVILSGGSGTRLWPVSRSKFPKQFSELFDESLFLKTLHRLKPFGSPWVVTNQSMKILTDTVMRSAGVPSEQSLYEPEARNTAPAIALICKVLELKGEVNSIAGVFPSDHLIQNTETFKNALQLSIECAKKGQVVTIGIKPTFPATGYGYIEVRENLFLEKSGLKAFQTNGFREKPSETLAREFIQSGNFYWNGGMFIFEVATMIRHLSVLMPELWQEMNKLQPDLSNFKEVYSRCPAQSIDYGVMEKLQEQVCVPCDLGWNDVGSWDEISKLTEPSDALEVGGNGNFSFSKQGRLIAFVDTDDLIVVDTADAILVSKKGSSQKVKHVVEALQAKRDLRVSDHVFEYRPWGRFEILRDTNDFKSKVIHVNPEQQLSYQSHSKRAEHWVIIKGHPEVVLNDKVHKLNPGESIYIPLGAKHRIRNPSQNEVVEFVEVQVGTYFGEDDIVRYQDDYKRS